jgi:NAD(P)-dependent dehydrogenase (short-subunit alcohol dehydrogenase family)
MTPSSINNPTTPQPRGDLQNRVALITGAASGIGLAITRRFVQEGALVALFDVNVERLQQAKDEILGMDQRAQILPIPCDITDEASVVQAVQATVAHFGRLNIAVNNAGVSVSVPSDE